MGAGREGGNGTGNFLTNSNLAIKEKRSWWTVLGDFCCWDPNLGQGSPHFLKGAWGMQEMGVPRVYIAATVLAEVSL